MKRHHRLPKVNKVPRFDRARHLWRQRRTVDPRTRSGAEIRDLDEVAIHLDKRMPPRNGGVFEQQITDGRIAPHDGNPPLELKHKPPMRPIPNKNCHCVDGL